MLISGIRPRDGEKELLTVLARHILLGREVALHTCLITAFGHLEMDGIVHVFAMQHMRIAIQAACAGDALFLANG